MSRSIKTLIATLTASLAIAGVAQTASAATSKNATVVNSIPVRFGDLNLQDEAAAGKLLRRLSNAANYVCNLPPPGPANFHLRNERQTCRDQALHNAVATVDHPVVTALYRSKHQTSITLAKG